MESIHSTLPHSGEIRGLRPWGSVSSTISTKKSLYKDNHLVAVCPLGHAAGGCEYLADGDENGNAIANPKPEILFSPAPKRTRG
jgi:hypothetical protein